MESSQRKWVVPAFWDNLFLEELDKEDLSQHIYEVFGSLPSSAMGTMLTRASLPDVTPEALEDFVKQLHSRGIKFAYALNALAMGNLEYTGEGKRKILGFLEWLASINADSVIVSNPFIAMLARENFPSFDISVSSAASVDAVKKAGFWAEMGASSIKLPLVANRNFPLLKSLTENVRLDMEVMVNQLCLYQCPMERYHTITTNTDSQVMPEQKEKPPFLDWCRLECNLIRWSNPAELLKSPIVRPEDIPLYQQYGIKYFKIIGRNKNMRHQIIDIIKAYVSEKWRGNLLSIVGVNANPPPYELTQFYPEEDFKRYFSQPLYYVDNARLDGFINHFITQGDRCAYRCGACQYCDETARKVIEIPSPARLTGFLNALKELKEATKTS